MKRWRPLKATRDAVLRLPTSFYEVRKKGVSVRKGAGKGGGDAPARHRCHGDEPLQPHSARYRYRSRQHSFEIWREHSEERETTHELSCSGAKDARVGRWPTHPSKTRDSKPVGSNQLEWLEQQNPLRREGCGRKRNSRATSKQRGWRYRRR
jgi:hypothetical protein